MSYYIMIRRLRAPAILLLAGGIALLHQTGIIHRGWSLFWPLLLILLGVLLLAERAALAAEGGYPPPMPYPGAPYPGAPSATTGVPAYPGQPQAQSSTSHAPASDQESEGGRS